MRELIDTRCPCLDGWTCCEEQNICRPQGTACDEGGDGGDSGWSTADASQDASLPPQEVCDGSSRVCSDGGTNPPSATAQALVGRWQRCEGSGFLGGDGIEFTEDGTYFLLGLDTEGVLQRVAGLHSTGNYLVGSTPDDPNDYLDLNVYFQFPEGGGASFFPSFDATQTHMHTGGGAGNESDYVRVEPGEDNVPGVVVPKTCGATDDCDPWHDGATLTCPGAPFSFAHLDS